MEWWFVPIGLVLAVLARLLWVAAFHPGETVSSVPALDGYVPGDDSTGSAVALEAPLPRQAADSDVREPAPVDADDDPASAPVDADGDPASAPVDADGDPASTPVDAPAPAPVFHVEPPDPGVGDGGIWIELDIEPLFASSETSRLVDLTEEQEPGATL